MRIQLFLKSALPLSILVSACGADAGNSVGTVSSAETVSATFLVVYRLSSVPSSAAADIAAAGGTLVASYPAIGVVVARAGTQAFVTKLSSSPLVEGVAPTTGAGVSALPTTFPTRKLPPAPPPATSGEPFAGMQWNMGQIHAAEARAITPGKKAVVVGVLDSGIDDTLPDLKGQVDPARSATCIGGVANTDPAVWRNDVIGHGTHVAGIIGAKENGKGVVGVAPGATLAAVKLSEDGFIYPEAFVCGIYWAATHGFDLVNASLFTDPWYYNCPTDPTQRLITLAEQRAVSFASARGVTVIAAASNENQDLAHKTVDPFSPTDAPTVERAVTNSCKLLPVELGSVVGVSAVGGDARLAYYSNYGLGDIDVAAPGGDLHVAVPGNDSGQIISPIPAYSFIYDQARFWNGRVGVGCTDGLDPNDENANPSTCAETYALLQGTSMAAPHVTGVAALAISRFGKMPTELLLTKLQLGATSLACPKSPYQPYPEEMPAETCEGAGIYNGFYGAGEVDALRTVR